MEAAIQKAQHYKLTQSLITVDNEVITTYGIEGNAVKFIDASPDKEKVLEMIGRINREQLEESQFMYFIQDELDR